MHVASRRKIITLAALLFIIFVAHWAKYEQSEPFYFNDETRHIMTSVYFRDVIHDLPVTDLRAYTIDYYLQYPALGLLVWPPFFYIIAGVAMTVFGTSVLVAKLTVGLFVALACVYLFRLASRASGSELSASLAVLIFALSPLVFEFSHFVMLEMPTLALALVSLFHFTRYLDEDRRRDIFIAAVAAALAALTRFDAVYLLPLFLILLVVRRRFGVLRRKSVLMAAAVAVLLVLPFYALTASGVGWLHFRQVTENLSPQFPAFTSLTRYIYYPSYLPEQLGWLALAAGLIGLIINLRSAERRRGAWPFLAMIAATYATFTPMGEMESRHAIYWTPAFAFFAAEAVAWIAARTRTPQLHLPLAFLLIALTAWTTLAAPKSFVRGYAEAANHVAQNSDSSPFCLFVGMLNGDFAYQLRRHDDARRLWMLRADKIFYSSLINQQVEMRQFAASEQEILDVIFRYDPQFIVVEEPSPEARNVAARNLISLDADDRVRHVIFNHAERFTLEQTINLESNSPAFRGTQLKIFRNTLRNPNPVRRIDIELLMLRRSIQTSVE